MEVVITIPIVDHTQLLYATKKKSFGNIKINESLKWVLRLK